jgi:hypothetical protein
MTTALPILLARTVHNTALMKNGVRYGPTMPSAVCSRISYGPL